MFGLIRKPAKTIRSRLAWRYRMATWNRRVLPNFVIIGAMKSGTTSLFHYLAQHPQLHPSSLKEVHFFDRREHFSKGESWYRAHFPLRSELGTDGQTYEGSPRYLFDPRTPQRIFELIPNVKLIAVLRNPTDRAISHYFHEERRGREQRPILQALREEDEAVGSVIRNREFESPVFIHQSYKHRGLYRQQIENVLGVFPRRQLLVISSDALVNEPEKCFAEVLSFLSIDSAFRISTQKTHNAGENRRDIDNEVYDYLNAYFATHNQALYDLLDEDFGW